MNWTVRRLGLLAVSAAMGLATPAAADSVSNAFALCELFDGGDSVTEPCGLFLRWVGAVAGCGDAR